MAQKNSLNDIHSAFVTTEDGTSLSELVQVLGAISLTPILVPLLIPWLVPSSFVKQAVANKDFFFLIRAILEYPILALLPLFIVTLFPAHFPENVVLISLGFGALSLIVCNHAVTAPKWLGLQAQWDKIKDLPTGWTKTSAKSNEETTSTIKEKKNPFITNYRAIVLYITILCILAVDFPVFPRRFAKTKSYGISLMDVGTGCFIFSNGIVAPEARKKHSPLLSSLKSSIPIVLLGIIRLISVKGIEYQEVVEEYGVHWNFFFTLAAVKILSSVIFTVVSSSHGLKLGIIVSLMHEMMLTYGDLQNQYILNSATPREGVLDANREGIFSITGYLSIYLFSVYIGKIIASKDRTSMRDWLEYAVQSFLQVVLAWGVYAVLALYVNQPCRRTANASYVIFMVALNYSLMWFQMFLALLQVTLQHTGLIYGPILFYKLNEHNKKKNSRMQRLSKESSEVKRKVKDAQRMAVDAKLKELEDQLNHTSDMLKDCQAGTRAHQELFQDITRIENAMAELEGNIEFSTGDENEEEPTMGDNLVLLPDLSKSPIILEAICYNGLLVFLLGNLLTGLINSMVHTMYTPDYLSVCYLGFYATVISTISLSLYWYRIQLKFW